MAGIPEDLIEEIRTQADILQIVGEHVPLRRSGRTYRGPCPLHGGEKPNFSVDPQRGIFKCFVCGESGDVFSFPMKRLGLNFVDAVRYVAERAGIEVPETGGPVEDPHRDLREAIAFAADWYRRQLWESDEGKIARDYLERRDVPREAAESFGLGYAPDAWRALRDAAHGHEIDDDRLERAGLVKRSEKAKEPYDHFRGRLIFPIEDLRGRPIGFGGRTLRDDPAAPKYLNSPDTPIFHKGRLLHGLARARNAIRREECALLVEGFMDHLSLAARGIENVVAPLGTGLTRDQATLLGRYAGRAVLLYDSDAAGLRATFRAGDELLRAGVHPHVGTLPPGEDPDSLVRGAGAEAIRSLLDGAVDVLDRKVQILAERGFFDSIDGKRRAVDALLPTVRAAADETLRDLYLDRVAQVTGVRRVTLDRELRSEPPSRRPAARPEERTGPPRLGPERKVLVLLLRDRSLREAVARELVPEDFQTVDYREIYRGLLESAAEEANQPWLERMPPDRVELVHELTHDPEEFTDPERVLRNSVDRLRARRLRHRREDLKQRLTAAPDDEEKMKILVQIQDLDRSLAAARAEEPGGRSVAP